jgi:hypothetical protein
MLLSTVALYHENIKVGTYIVSTRDTDHTLVEIVFKSSGIIT